MYKTAANKQLLGVGKINKKCYYFIKFGFNCNVLWRHPTKSTSSKCEIFFIQWHLINKLQIMR